MTDITKWEIRLTALIVLLLVGVGLYEEHRAAQSGIEGMRQTIQSIEEGRKSEQQALQATLQAIAQTKRATVTSAQVIRELPQVITLPAPIIAAAPISSQSPAGNVPSDVPDRPQPVRPDSGTIVATGALIPPEDLKPLFDRLADCKACDAQVASDQATIEQVTKERDVAVKAAKGGSFWHRLKHDAKIVGITLVIGAAVGYAAHR